MIWAGFSGKSFGPDTRLLLPGCCYLGILGF
jgi:hypothetical protein